MEEKKNILTYDGYKKMEDELRDLKVFRRKEVAQKIKEAREQGDLSENAEYDAARDEQREIEKRIGPLEEQSKVAREYLNLKEQLKKLELNHFLCEYDKSDSARQALEEKFNTANDQLNETKAANENAETEYRRLEGIIEDYNKALEDAKNFRQELLIGNEKMEGEIKLFEQQMIAITQNSERINERIAAKEVLYGQKRRSQPKDHTYHRLPESAPLPCLPNGIHWAPRGPPHPLHPGLKSSGHLLPQ